MTKRHLYFAIGALLVYAAMFIGLVSALYAADPPKPPVIPDQLKAAFFKAQAQFLQAGEKVRQAEDERAIKEKMLNGAINDLSKFCGDILTVQWDDKQEPACVAKIPVVNKAPEVKKP